ncbi:MAG: hypothetical protein K0S26_1096 [Bacteroidota bacterium]|jgi:hypothetical protein|nr:hypothetical protein [Bacteroidota bacterium]
MKKVTAIALYILLISYSLKSQITLENVYTNGDVKLCNLTTGGYKYYLLDKINNQIKMYNTSHSIFKTINIATPASGYTYTYVKLLSDNLFDTDNLIEFILICHNNAPPYDNPNKIYNENGTLLLQSYKQDEFTVYNVGGSYKLKRYSSVSGGQDTSRIFSLPGTLPCDACGGPTSIVKNNATATAMPNAYPNPTSEQITIPYYLPNGERTGKVTIYDINGKSIREYSVDDTFSNLILDTKEFNAGTYYYNLTTADGVSDVKKIIVLK